MRTLIVALARLAVAIAVAVVGILPHAGGSYAAGSRLLLKIDFDAFLMSASDRVGPHRCAEPPYKDSEGGGLEATIEAA